MLTFGLTCELRPLSPLKDEPALEQLQKLVRTWYEDKLRRPQLEDRHFRDQQSLHRSELGDVWEFALSQTADTEGTWETEIRVYSSPAKPHDLTLTVAMRLKPSTDHVAPVSYYVETPSFVKRLRTKFQLHVGTSQAHPALRRFVNPLEVRSFAEELLSGDRSLPIVLITEPARSVAPIPMLGHQLADYLFALANVVYLDRLATFELTHVLGKELSCFDGGVRLYWPNMTLADTPLRHPLFTRSRIEASLRDDPAHPDRLIRTSLMARLSKAGAARFAYPETIRSVVAISRRNSLEQELAGTTTAQLIERVEVLTGDVNEQRDYVELALAENSELHARIELLEQELAAARRETERLRTERRPSAQKLEEPEVSRGDGEYEDDSPWAISDPRDALERARTDFPQTLVIPHDVELETDLSGGVVYHVLLALHELCSKERRGDAKNKRQALRDLLAQHVGLPKDTYKVADSGVYRSDPVTGQLLHLRERVHLKEGKPSETESIYWHTIGEKQSAYKYLIGRIGRHA